jgi:ribonuclease Y
MTIVIQGFIWLSVFGSLWVLAYRFMKKQFQKKESDLRESLKLKEKEIIQKTKDVAQNMIRDAKLAAKEMVLKMKNEFEESTRETRKELLELEKHITHREKSFEKKEELLMIKETKLKQREDHVGEEEKRVELSKQNILKLQRQTQSDLERVSKLTIGEAKEQLKTSLTQEVQHELAGEVRRLTQEAEEEAKKRAQRVVAIAVSRYAGETSAEKLIYNFHLESDDLKGKIIGKEGRNIRAIEAATGVDLIVDDTPETVTISSFDPLRRETARRLIERLLQDGRIHPARIEEMAHKINKEVLQVVTEEGRQAAFELGIHNLHPEIIKVLGTLKFRTSYQQNQLHHSIEVGFLAGALAAELRADEKVCRRGGLLHDIGKALVHTLEGPHAVVGADFCKRYGERDEVTHCIRAHHEDVPLETVEAHIVQAADTLSGARPGARRENLDRYVKRLEDIEKVASSFDGVEKVYAIQAGREVRVIVNNQQASDDDAVMLSREIAKKIEEELKYPGQVKVTVIRETRAVALAK